MGILQAIRAHMTGPPTVIECRHCGESLPQKVDTCETCGSSEIARYHC